MTAAGRIERAETFESETDSEALIIAVVRADGRSTELWQLERKVRVLPGAAPPTSADNLPDPSGSHP